MIELLLCFSDSMIMMIVSIVTINNDNDDDGGSNADSDEDEGSCNDAVVDVVDDDNSDDDSDDNSDDDSDSIEMRSESVNVVINSSKCCIINPCLLPVNNDCKNVITIILVSLSIPNCITSLSPLKRGNI